MKHPKVLNVFEIATHTKPIKEVSLLKGYLLVGIQLPKLERESSVQQKPFDGSPKEKY